MVTYTMNIGLNRIAVAEEVISSAGNILVAAGFKPAEIAALFQEAAEQLVSGEAADRTDDVSRAEIGVGGVDLDDIRAEFEEIAPVLALAKLKRRADALDRPHDNREALAKCYTLAEKMLPLIGEAQNWLRASAAENDISVVDDQNKWASSASDEELDHEHEIMFICEFEWSYPLCLDFIGSVLSELVEKGEEEKFNYLVSELLDGNVTLPSEILEAIEEGKVILTLKSVFWDHVLSQSEDVQEKQFLEAFVKTTGFPRRSHFLIGWLQQMEEGRLIERYKASNRWRLRVI